MDRLTSVLLAAGLGCFLLAFARSAEALTDRELQGVSRDEATRMRSKEAWIDAHADALRRGGDLYIGEACWHCQSQFVRPVSNDAQRFGRVRTAADDNNALQRPVRWGTRRVGPDLTNVGGRRSNDWHVAHLYDPQSTSPDSVMPRYTWYFERGFHVFRSADPEIVARERLPADTRYPLPGVYPTQAAAAAALERHRAELPENLRSEGERLSVAPSMGPNSDAIALIAYVQWLGT